VIPAGAAQLADTMVLFDWNGTVVIDGDRARDALNGVLERRGLDLLDETQFASRFRLPMGEMFHELGVASGALLTAEAEWNAHMASETTRLRAGSAATLDRLHAGGAWMGVVSAASINAVDFDRASLGVPDVWRSVEAPVVDKVAALAAHRHERARAFYVGDTAYDMRSATEAGYVPIGVAGGYAPVEVLHAAGARHIIESLDELLPLVVK
jgi:phosphoglycolate phosphatase